MKEIREILTKPENTGSIRVIIGLLAFIVVLLLWDHISNRIKKIKD